MKKLTVLPFLALLWACGGAGDDKNAADNYPTYDTASTPMHMNDSTTTNDMQSEGSQRHNIDDDRERED